MLPTGKRGRGNAPDLTDEDYALFLIGNLVNESRQAGEATKEVNELPHFWTRWSDVASPGVYRNDTSNIYCDAKDGSNLLPSDLDQSLLDRMTPANVLAAVLHHTSYVDAELRITCTGGNLITEIQMYSKDRGPLTVEPQEVHHTFWKWAEVTFRWSHEITERTDWHNWSNWMELTIPAAFWRVAQRESVGGED
ncbi:MAG: hypothetical protein AAF755_00155 [Pseudomonadota bacterium]